MTLFANTVTLTRTTFDREQNSIHLSIDSKGVSTMLFMSSPIPYNSHVQSTRSASESKGAYLLIKLVTRFGAKIL